MLVGEAVGGAYDSGLCGYDIGKEHRVQDHRTQEQAQVRYQVQQSWHQLVGFCLQFRRSRVENLIRRQDILVYYSAGQYPSVLVTT